MNKNHVESLLLLPFCSLSTAVPEVQEHLQQTEGLPFTAMGAGDNREVGLPALACISTTLEQPPGKTWVLQVVSSWMHLPSVKQGDVSGATQPVSRLL